MGLASYYRRFMRGFASNVAPFHCLMGKGKELVWNPECDMAFSSLKRLLTTATTLAYPHFENEFVIDCDASGGGLGAVLSQSIDDVEHVISFASRSLEWKYCTIRKEMLPLYGRWISSGHICLEGSLQFGWTILHSNGCDHSRNQGQVQGA